MRNVLVITGVLLSLALIISIRNSGTPVFTVPRMIPESFVSSLEQHPPAWGDDPVAVAMQLIHFGATDPIDVRGTIIRRVDSSDGTVLVTIDDRYVADDSTSRTYDAVRLKRRGLSWIPIEHQWAQQGRDVFGWTTSSTY